jgi:hypothetical protein
MKNVSNAFKEVIKNGGPFYAYAKFKLVDGTELEMTSRKDFYISGNSYTQGGQGQFPLGEAVSKTIDIGIDNLDERYSSYDFNGCQIVLYTEADLANGTIERLQEGVFTVIDSVTPGDIIELTAQDNMYKADIKFKSTISYPTKALLLLQEICTVCGLSLASTSDLAHISFQINSAPNNVTARQVLGYIAQIMGGNALILPNGQLKIQRYKKEDIAKMSIISGGNLADNIADYISGGKFGETVEDVISGEGLNESLQFHILNTGINEPTIATDDIIITGLTTEVAVKGSSSEKQTITYGTEGYMLNINNPLIKGREEAGLKVIGNVVIGISTRPFSGDFSPNPTIEYMDSVYIVDRKDNIYQSIVSSHTFTYLGNSSVSNNTPSNEKKNATYQSNASDIYRKAQEDIEQNKTEWEKTAEILNNELQNASGLFQTTQTNPDGSTIYFLHDKKTLEESQVVIKVTSQAIGISTDGGNTYPTGITVDGDAIVSILQSVGINADWINTGTLKVGGKDNGNGLIQVYDKNGDLVGKINNEGLTIETGGSVKSKATASKYVQLQGSNIYFHNSIKEIAVIEGSTSSLDFYVPSSFHLFKGAYKSPNAVQVMNYNGSANTTYIVNLSGTIKTASVTDSFVLNDGSTFTIQNNVTTDIYSDMDMHLFTLSNVKLSKLDSVNGKGVLSGRINFISSLNTDSNGQVINYSKGYIDVEDGVIVGGASD